MSTAAVAPTAAAAKSFMAKTNFFSFIFVGGGAEAEDAILLALSRRVPELTDENSGFKKKITLSKYSQSGRVISTTWWFTP